MLKSCDIALLQRKKTFLLTLSILFFQIILEEIQTLKDQLKYVNIVQDVPSQTRNSCQNQQNQLYQLLQPRHYYVSQRPLNRVQQNRFQRSRLIQGQKQNYFNSQIHRHQRQSNQQRYHPVVELIVSLNLNVQLEMLFAICAIKSAIF